ncbi:DUF1565 domain-containing protein [Okeania sp.]|uniref:DUF1565 domain-containing protein n=1 Tax=Okeania sp. TaxID=3100323 RepID=UPI002B4B1A66|nr:DUF1565 domain-containing protein [Okeania sp.]MEB3342223.1 DUF1565 domain-containing protein [Okeania sp.]
MNLIFILFWQENNQTNLVRKINYLSPLLATALLGLFTSTSLAVPLVQKVAQSPETQTNSQTNVLYVSSSIGKDFGDGTKTAPLQTITYALKIARPNTTILLAPGTYSRQTGEVFPLILQPKIAIKGNYFNSGKNVVIEGGGNFKSPTRNRQNITIFAGNDSTLSGVTVTNPNSQGYGLLIESHGSFISKNTFTGNRLNGISVVGNSTAIIQENSFYDNVRSGITIYDNSQPEIRNNFFQNTGVGINISDDSAPQIIGNRLIENQNGIIVQGNAKPTLRGNYIENNRQNGVKAIAQSLPDLGNSQEPGRNTIRHNFKYDIYSEVEGKTIPAYGNSLGGDRNYGSIDMNGKVALSPRVAPSSSNVSQAKTIEKSEERSKSSGVISQPRPENSTSKVITIPVPPPQNQRGARGNSNSEVITIPVPPPQNQRGARIDSNNTTSRRRNSQRIIRINPDYQNRPKTETPERLRNLPPRNTPSNESNAPVASLDLLPVPTANIPLGSGGYVPPVIARNQSPSSLSRLSSNSSSQNPTAALGLRYRVIVNVSNIDQESRLRSLVPDAFSTNINGKSVMQAGAFRSGYKANQLLRTLQNNGLNAKILPMQN